MTIYFFLGLVLLVGGVYAEIETVRARAWGMFAICFVITMLGLFAMYGSVFGLTW